MAKADAMNPDPPRMPRKFESDALTLIVPDLQPGHERDRKGSSGRRKAAPERFPATREVIQRLIEWFEKG